MDTDFGTYVAAFATECLVPSTITIAAAAGFAAVAAAIASAVVAAAAGTAAAASCCWYCCWYFHCSFRLHPLLVFHGDVARSSGHDQSTPAIVAAALVFLL